MNSWELSLIYSIGKNAGLKGSKSDECPYSAGERKLAWLMGFKAGQYAKDKAL
ncbi:Rmf/CrpP family protein [Leclercia sp.]|uniref:Rmf/CrpP family protein n=1 Tax=Leclercia sp. TaxID=1898428 RepID=UPI0028A93C5B|nr:Rmf/CrpP family protein [Leclercia sp.]